MPKAKIFFDIGSNKGYAAAEFYELWNSELGISRKSLKQVHLTLERSVIDAGYFSECGGCNECYDTVEPLLVSKLSRACSPKACKSTASHAKQVELSSSCAKLCDALVKDYDPIKVFSFDANPQMTLALGQSLDKLVAKQIPELESATNAEASVEPLKQKIRATILPNLKKYWHVINVALSGAIHPESVSVVLFEGELGRVNLVPFQKGVDDERSATHWVKIKENPEMQSGIKAQSLVEAVQASIGNDQRIDLLKIDVEGHDYDVLVGGRPLFESHRVTVVKFEYGQLWSGSQVPTRLLRDAVTMFDTLEYACYMEGKNGLIKLTQGCWSDLYETKFWVNVWCVSQQVVEGLAIANALDGFCVAFW
jgi:FkbM family methyltransferase